jgi:SNF2 family DNA or RNA helicase
MLDRTDLKPYQVRAVKFLVGDKPKPELPHKALWLDMGLGKTIITLTALVDLKAAGQLQRPALLVGTIRIIYSVWRQEARKWKHTRSLRFSLVHGTLQERLAALRKPADVYLINYENLKWLHSLTEIDRPNFGIFIADESSRLKGYKTKRFKVLKGEHRGRRFIPGMIPWFTRRWLLTGTPTPNSMMDLWSQAYILDEGQRFGQNFEFFRGRFFENVSNPWEEYPSYQLRRGAQQRIQRAIAPLVMRLDAHDYVKMPRVMHNEIRLELPDGLRRMYDDMERRMFLELDKVDVEVFNAATLTTKCWQFANGALYGTSKEHGDKDWEAVHDLKLDALEETLEEAEGSPVLVPYWFKSDLARLKERLAHRFPKGVPSIGSGVKPADADRTVTLWNKGKLEVLLVHYVTAAHGLNLQAGGHILFMFSQTWSLELHDQIIARLARQGQSHPVMVHTPRVYNTVDMAIDAAIERKAAGQRGLLDALRHYRDVRELIG